MEAAKGFVALVAPWLARPGDVPISRLVVAIVLALIVIGGGTVVYQSAAAIRELLPAREAAP